MRSWPRQARRRGILGAAAQNWGVSRILAQNRNSYTGSSATLRQFDCPLRPLLDASKTGEQRRHSSDLTISLQREFVSAILLPEELVRLDDFNHLVTRTLPSDRISALLNSSPPLHLNANSRGDLCRCRDCRYSEELRIVPLKAVNIATMFTVVGIATARHLITSALR